MFLKNWSISKVLESASWRLNSVFASFYFEDIQYVFEGMRSLGPFVVAGTVALYFVGLTCFYGFCRFSFFLLGIRIPGTHSGGICSFGECSNSEDGCFRYCMDVNKTSPPCRASP